MEDSFKYILAGREGILRGAIPEDFKILSPSDNIVFAKSIEECLNAERNGADAVIWNAEDYEQLVELSPRSSEYGWMLVSINIPIFFHLTDIDQIENLKNAKIHGFYGTDLDVLLQSRKKVETLWSE